jgi:hypothetical protein
LKRRGEDEKELREREIFPGEESEERGRNWKRGGDFLGKGERIEEHLVLSSGLCSGIFFL